MKIAIITNTSWNLLNFRLNLMQGLRDDGHDIVAIAPHDDSVEQISALGFEHHHVFMDAGGTNPVNDTKTILDFRRIFKKTKPDVILCFTAKPNIYASLAAHSLKIPVINNISGLGSAFLRDNFVTRILQFLYKRALKKSYLVFFQNRDDYELFMSHKIVTSDMVGFLPGSGVDLEHFCYETLPDVDAPIFTLVARMLRDKGVVEYIDACRILQKKNLNVQFLLAGFTDSDNATAIHLQEINGWEKEGIVSFLGPQSDVRPIISRSSCIVLPSYREGTPKILLEAAAMGRPIITTNVPGCRQTIDDRENGFLCEVKNAQDLAQKMEDFIALSREDQQKMGDASRVKAEREYDVNIVIDRYRDAVAAIG